MLDLSVPLSIFISVSLLVIYDIIRRYIKNNQPNALIKKAEQSFEYQRYDESIKILLKVLKRESGNAQFHYNIGCLYNLKNQKDISIKYYEKAIQLNPEHINAILALSNHYYEKKNYFQAVLLLKKAINIEPKNYSAHFSLAKCYLELGDTESACLERDFLDKYGQQEYVYELTDRLSGVN